MISSLSEELWVSDCGFDTTAETSPFHLSEDDCGLYGCWEEIVLNESEYRSFKDLVMRSVVYVSEDNRGEVLERKKYRR